MMTDEMGAKEFLDTLGDQWLPALVAVLNECPVNANTIYKAVSTDTIFGPKHRDSVRIPLNPNQSIVIPFQAL